MRILALLSMLLAFSLAVKLTSRQDPACVDPNGDCDRGCHEAFKANGETCTGRPTVYDPETNGALWDSIDGAFKATVGNPDGSITTPQYP